MNQVVWATKPIAAGKRAEDDFYATPAECVTALLPHIEDFPGTIWEPACGDGAISRVLLNAGRTVASSDVVNRGSCDVVADFLTSPSTGCPLRSIVTNPPYSLAEKFIRKAFDLGCTHIAMLLKSNFWHARREGLFEQHPPSEILPLVWRPDFTGAGSPFLDVAWNVWRPASCGLEARTHHWATTYTRLHRPKGN